MRATRAYVKYQNKRYKVTAKLDIYMTERQSKNISERVKKLEFDINKMLLTDAGSVCKLRVEEIEKLPF